MIKPVMSQEVEQEVLNALVQFRQKDKWAAWGLNRLRKQGAAFLLYGPSGTGKSTICKWIAWKVERGLKKLGASALVSDGAPGQYEAKIKEFFDDCRKRKNATIFIDECDHLFLNRDELGDAGNTWQLGGIEALMMEMNEYPGLILCATNHEKLMDTALADRFLAIIEVKKPDFEMRKLLWLEKIPETFPLQLTEAQENIISEIPLTGRQIESVILNCASSAIRQMKKPTFDILCHYAYKAAKQKL